MAERAAERVRRAIKSISVHLDPKSNQPPIHVSASVGVAGTDLTRVRCATELYEAADRALLSAKRRGKDRVEITQDLKPYLRKIQG